MIKRAIFLVIGLMLMAVVGSAQEPATWSAYLFDNINYELIRVNADGSTASFLLDVAENDYVSLNDISISHNGQYAAYCKSAFPEENQSMGIKTLVIDEIGSGTLVSIPYGEEAACAVTAFSDDDSMLALSIVHYDFMQEAPAGEALWSLRILNVRDGELVHELQSTDAFMPAFIMFGDNVPMLANVSQFDHEAITFAGYPYVGMDGPERVPVYEWDFADTTVTELPAALGRINSDYLPASGETVYPALDESLDAAQPDGPLPMANIVNIRDAEGTTNTIYQNEEWVIVSTTFVNDGESIAILLLHGFDPNLSPMESNSLRLEFLNRDGTVNAVDQSFAGSTQVENIPDAALIIYTPNPTGPSFDNPTQIHIWDGSTLTQIGEVMPDYSTGWSPPQLLWVTPFTGNADLPAFTPTI